MAAPDLKSPVLEKGSFVISLETNIEKKSRKCSLPHYQDARRESFRSSVSSVPQSTSHDVGRQRALTEEKKRKKYRILGDLVRWYRTCCGRISLNMSSPVVAPERAVGCGFDGVGRFLG